MSHLWQAEGLFKEIRDVQDMFQDIGSTGHDSWRNKIQLVEAVDS